MLIANPRNSDVHRSDPFYLSWYIQREAILLPDRQLCSKRIIRSCHARNNPCVSPPRFSAVAEWYISHVSSSSYTLGGMSKSHDLVPMTMRLTLFDFNNPPLHIMTLPAFSSLVSHAHDHDRYRMAADDDGHHIPGLDSPAVLPSSYYPGVEGESAPHNPGFVQIPAHTLRSHRDGPAAAAAATPLRIPGTLGAAAAAAMTKPGPERDMHPAAGIHLI